LRSGNAHDGKSDASNGKTDTFTDASSGTADVTVNDTSEKQTWEGWCGAFNALGWSLLTSTALQDEAMKLLFAADGAHFNWGRIPMGASDYAMSRYALDDPSGPDPTPNGESARLALDTTLAKFSLSRDKETLSPFIKAAEKVRPDLKFWASPWTAPIPMKSGYASGSSDTGGTAAKKPSCFDGGNMKSDASVLTAYAELYKKFGEGYKAEGINIEIVSPQNEPRYQQNYPSCLWDKTTCTNFVGKYLGPAM
jgi:glucosylceramidase